VLASTLSPQVAALQQQILDLPPQVGAAPFGVCDAPASDPQAKPSVQLPSNARELLGQACVETVGGFEQAYKVTFFASIIAVVLGLMLPGWPGKWAGRRAVDAPIPIAH
jgi:hypothetical protein